MDQMDDMDYVEQSILHIKTARVLHVAAKVKAAKVGITLNQYVVGLIEQDVGKETLINTGDVLHRIDVRFDKLEPEPPRPPDPETGYPCCAKAKPCKHWQWDGVKSAYVNELTGKEREAL